MSNPHGVASNEGGAVSENDIMKAEDIQPNEMNDLHNFLKNTNQVQKNYDGERGEAEMTDGKFVSNNDGTEIYYVFDETVLTPAGYPSTIWEIRKERSRKLSSFYEEP